jgi:4-aminobutyrate aminotransferase
MGGTYCSNAISCAAANAVLDAFEHENVLGIARQRHQEILGHLGRIYSTVPSGLIREIRGSGLMIGTRIMDLCNVLFHT